MRVKGPISINLPRPIKARDSIVLPAAKRRALCEFLISCCDLIIRRGVCVIMRDLIENQRTCVKGVIVGVKPQIEMRFRTSSVYVFSNNNSFKGN